jgi:hypothetical protein
MRGKNFLVKCRRNLFFLKEDTFFSKEEKETFVVLLHSVRDFGIPNFLILKSRNP